MARRRTSKRKQAAHAAEGWPSLEIRADVEEDAVVEAVARLLWDVQKSRENTGRNGMGSRELNCW